MKLKRLKSILDDVDSFETPKVHLEQYPTPPDIAAEMMHHIFAQGEIEGKLVADLGCGGGILSVAASLLDAGHVVGFDVDAAALQVCSRNCHEMELTGVDLVQRDLSQDFDPRWHAVFDTTVMNPPFGTRTKGLDIAFLKASLFITSGPVYSLHKTSTREYIVKKAEELGVDCRVIAELRYNIDRMYIFHKQESRDIAVDFVRFSPKTTTFKS